MNKVLVFGSLNMDSSVECSHIPHLGETIIGSPILRTPGGRGANQAVAAARMGTDTFMIGKVGNDGAGRELLANLAIHGVSGMNVSVTARAETGHAVILRAEGDNCVIVAPGANAAMSYDEVRAAIHGFAGKGNVFLAQLECDFDVTMKSILCAKRNGLFTILNASPAACLPDDVCQSLDLLCVNESECEVLCGIAPNDDASCKAALDSFAERGIGCTVITLGEKGSVTLKDGELVRVASYEVDAVDTTSAGDAYLGELAAHLAFDPGDVIGGMKLASAAAALSCTKVGGQEAMPSWDELQEFLADRGVNA